VKKTRKLYSRGERTRETPIYELECRDIAKGQIEIVFGVWVLFCGGGLTTTS